MPRAVVGLAAVVLASTLACCGGKTPTAPTTRDTPVPAVDPATQGLVITFGFSGIYFLYSGVGEHPLPSYDNLVMLGNFIKKLGEGRAPQGSLRVFYTTTRPQPTITDPQNRPWYGPFLDMMAPIGTVDFGLPSRVDLASYTVLIYDACEALGRQSERDAVREYLARGGRALVLGCNACTVGGTPSTELANEMVVSLGITFTRADPDTREPLHIPPAQQTGVLEGVQQVSVFRVSPQVVTAPAVPLVTSGGSVLAALATFKAQ